jgi:hypothetical protein
MLDISRMHTIYVLCRKIYNLFVQALETCRIMNLWQAFLAYFTVSANKFYVYWKCTLYVYCVYPAMPKKSKITAKLSEKFRNNNRSNHFQWCPLCHPCLYCYRFYYQSSTWIRYQKSFIRSMTIVGNPPLIPIRYSLSRGTYQNQPWVTDDGPWLNNIEVYFGPFISTQNHTITG